MGRWRHTLEVHDDIARAVPETTSALPIDSSSVLSANPHVLERCSEDALLTPESLECLGIFKTGDIFIYQLGSDFGQLKPSNKVGLSLTHILIPSLVRYHPVLSLMILGRKPNSAFEAPDISLTQLALT